MVLMNLPRAERFKPENVFLVGIIPGPHEPKLNINTYLKPLVAELNALWENGVSLRAHGSTTTQLFHAALLKFREIFKPFLTRLTSKQSGTLQDHCSNEHVSLPSQIIQASILSVGPLQKGDHWMCADSSVHLLWTLFPRFFRC